MPSLPQAVVTYTFYPIPVFVFPFWQEVLNFESEFIFLSHVETLHNFQVRIPHGYFIGKARVLTKYRLFIDTKVQRIKRLGE